MMMLSDEIKHGFRLAVSCSDPDNASSLKNVIGPLGRMARQDRRLQLMLPNRFPDGSWQLTWHWLAQCDALFIRDPHAKPHLDVMVLAKTLGLPIWLEWGDDLTSVRPSNPSWQHFSDSTGIDRRMRAAEAMADVITAHSQAMIETRPETVQPRIELLFMANYWPFYGEEGDRKKIVTWRGLSSHEGDLRTILEELKSIAEDEAFQEWQFAFMGDAPWCIREELGPLMQDRLLVIPYVPTAFEQMKVWDDLKPYAHICPLADHRFNWSKDPGAWMEASVMGAVCLVPDFLPEWRMPGAALYATPEGFGQELRRIMRAYDNGRFHPNVAAARAGVRQYCDLVDREHQRWSILNRLAELSRKNLVMEAKVVTGEVSLTLPPDVKEAVEA